MRKLDQACNNAGLKTREVVASSALNDLSNEQAFKFRNKALTLEAAINDKLNAGDVQSLIQESFDHTANAHFEISSQPAGLNPSVFDISSRNGRYFQYRYFMRTVDAANTAVLPQLDKVELVIP